MSRVRSLPLVSRRTLLLALAAIGALLLAFALVDTSPDSGDVSGGSSGSSRTTTSIAEPGPAVDPAAAPTDQAVAPDGGDGLVLKTEEVARDAAAGAADGDVASPAIAGGEIGAPSSTLDAPALDARIIRTAAIELRLKDGGFEEGWGDAQAVAGAFGGYVVSASRSGAGDDARFGTITMRVPSARFDAAVDRLRELSGAKVGRLDISSQDVTQEFVDVRSRLRHDRAVEGRLLALLAQTRGVSEVLAVQSRLDQVQEQIEISRGRLQYLEKLTAMSTIEVSLRAPSGKSGDEGDKDESVLGEAWTDARERFAENVAGAIVWVGGALPTLLVLLVVAAVARVAWRRKVRSDLAARTPETTP